MSNWERRLFEAKEFLVQKGVGRVRYVVVFGSGLGLDEREGFITIKASDIPGYPMPGVEGHSGVIVYDNSEGNLFIEGRKHLYEGEGIEPTLFNVRLAKTLGAGRVILTCAAGGLNPKFETGDIVLVHDLLNFQWGAFLPYWSSCRLSSTINEKIITSAHDLSIYIHQGTLCSIVGPSYETPAEAKMFRLIGADVMSMSILPEILEANALGLEVAVLAVVSNHHFKSHNGTSHSEVLAHTRQARGNLHRLIFATVKD
jgi:purine-nucleoside phosphorylase